MLMLNIKRKVKLSLQGERTIYFDSFHAFFPNIPTSQARQILVSSIEISGKWMTRALAVAEVPEINHRVS